MTRRREMLGLAGLAGLTGLAGLAAGGLATGADAAALAPGPAVDDLSSLYDVDRSLVNLDAAYYGAMTRTVQAEYLDRVQWANRRNAAYLRGAVEGHDEGREMDAVRAEVAGLIGADRDEIALSNGGTEALYALIANYRPLTPGDQVIVADVDYDEMQHAMGWLQQARGAEVVRIALPEPSTDANILAAYEQALKATPRAKLMLLTHLSNRHGLIPPVRQIIAMARARGVDVILDSAQAVGQIPVSPEETGADFIGFSLHKWVAAPLGTGAIYIRKSRVADISPWFGNRIHDADDVRARIPTGTVDFAARLTIPAAIALHRAIGPERKLARVRALRDRWVNAVRDIPGLEPPLPEAPHNHAATSAFRLPGMKTLAQTRQAQQILLHRHKVLVVAKPGLASGPVLRVTPSLFNTEQEIDQLVQAIRAERGMFS